MASNIQNALPNRFNFVLQEGVLESSEEGSPLLGTSEYLGLPPKKPTQEEAQEFLEEVSQSIFEINPVYNGNTSEVKKVAVFFYKKAGVRSNVEKWNNYYTQSKRTGVKRYANAFFKDGCAFYPSITGETFSSTKGTYLSMSHAMKAQAQFICEGYFHGDLFGTLNVNPGNFVFRKEQENQYYLPIDIDSFERITTNNEETTKIKDLAEKVMQESVESLEETYFSSELRQEFKLAIGEWEETKNSTYSICSQSEQSISSPTINPHIEPIKHQKQSVETQTQHHIEPIKHQKRFKVAIAALSILALIGTRKKFGTLNPMNIYKQVFPKNIPQSSI